LGKRVQNITSVVVDDGDALLQYRRGRNKEWIRVVVEGESIRITWTIGVTDGARTSVDLVHRGIGIDGEIVGSVQIGRDIQNIEGEILSRGENHVEGAS
jgi:hypothetical protein